jgi:heme oxygenase
MLHVQQTLERALRETSNRHVRSLARDWHVRSPLTRHDILALGGSIDAAPRTDAARRFCADIDAAAAHSPVALVGILYVLEGATNGNVYVGKALEKHLGLEPGRATRSLDPHGDQQRPRWLAFRAGLDELGLDEPQAEAVLAAARRTFQAVYEISDAMPA